MIGKDNFILVMQDYKIKFIARGRKLKGGSYLRRNASSVFCKINYVNCVTTFVITFGNFIERYAGYRILHN